MLTPIYFAGYMGPCEAQYGIHREQDTLHIVVIQSDFGTSLWNSAEARNHVLNTVLAREATGIQIDQIRFYVILDTRTSDMHGIELPIHLDYDDYRARGNPGRSKGLFRRVFEMRSHDAVAGSGRCYVDFDERIGLTADTIKRFCALLGYYSPHRIRRAIAPA
jgi:hypothetical protein